MLLKPSETLISLAISASNSSDQKPDQARTVPPCVRAHRTQAPWSSVLWRGQKEQNALGCHRRPLPSPWRPQDQFSPEQGKDRVAYVFPLWGGDWKEVAFISSQNNDEPRTLLTQEQSALWRSMSWSCSFLLACTASHPLASLQLITNMMSFTYIIHRTTSVENKFTLEIKIMPPNHQYDNSLGENRLIKVR